ncbi:hypothetical protein ISF6_5345 [Piscinibacter sakaiensis]|uniref:Uncharacterized protein n=1 Tax=Piscinibacter sakaiensis TaxID=1547922 RepID=A0A0K8P829_PISS1|nr:hypothetical protein ISF6_5345 [Piscinibacter sakaiensis]
MDANIPSKRSRQRRPPSLPGDLADDSPCSRAPPPTSRRKCVDP